MFGIQFLKTSLIFPRLLTNSKSKDLITQYLEKIESRSSYAQEMENWNLVRAALNENKDKDQML